METPAATSPQPPGARADGSLLLRTASLPWRPLGPGSWYRLLRASLETGAFTVMLRIEEGGAFLAHRHLGAADFYVFEGEVEYANGVALPGDWVYEPNGATHALTTCRRETVVLFHFHGPVVFLDPDGAPAMVVDSALVHEVAARGEGAPPEGLSRAGGGA